jgi:protein-tyrosine phosphatase
MVCLGNICRSPLAEGVLKKLLTEKRITNWIVDSAGIGGWHEGDLPDQRAIRVAKNHSIDITGQRARQIQRQDFSQFDHILVMDMENMRDALKISPLQHASKIRMIMDFKYPGKGIIVPDPYYTNRFEESFQLIMEGCEAFLEQEIVDRS